MSIGRVRAAFYDLLRNNDELRLHDEQIALAQQAVAAARIKYTVGRVPQQDVLKAQVGLTKLAEHLLMFTQDGDLARARLNTLMGRDPATPLEVSGDYSTPAALPSVSELATGRDRASARTEGHTSRSSAVGNESSSHREELQTGCHGQCRIHADAFRIATNRNGYMAELSLNLPWLNRSKHDAEIQEAQSQVNAQRAELQTAESHRSFRKSRKRSFGRIPRRGLLNYIATHCDPRLKPLSARRPQPTRPIKPTS